MNVTIVSMIMIVLFGLLVVELGVVFVPFLWRLRLAIASLLIVIGASSGVLLFINNLNILGGLALFVLTFRLLNFFRILEHRMHDVYLKQVVRRTSLMLGMQQILALLLVVWWPQTNVDFLKISVYLQVVLAVLLLVVTWRNIKTTKHVPVARHFADRDLPTVTVAIPARNETYDLEECLKSLVASDYPKLEIIVLDDCSQVRTSDIIRGFANHGVRFIQGEPPAERWLAKNQAYSKLVSESSGELILFCGVDVRFGSGAVRALVTTLLNKQKSMISVLPKRGESNPLGSVIQSMRYWWEMALPRRPFNRPAVLSTCWLIRRERLGKLGGFEAVSHTIIPEGYFARELVKEDGYSFIRSSNTLDVHSNKQIRDQYETAIRMRYPELRRRPEWVSLLDLIEIFLLILPLFLALGGFWLPIAPSVQILSALTVGLLALANVSIVLISDPANWLTALFSYPVVVLLELAVVNYSMFQYEFSTVDWKGRNICIPVMHTIPHQEFAAELTAGSGQR
jgi:glycosyltransferase involved in cell wall biosynthesis